MSKWGMESFKGLHNGAKNLLNFIEWNLRSLTFVFIHHPLCHIVSMYAMVINESALQKCCTEFGLLVQQKCYGLVHCTCSHKLHFFNRLD